MSAEVVDAAVSRAEGRRPDLAMAVQAMADALTAGEGTEMIHQAALQQFLWWHLPRKYPEEDWTGLADAAAELLDELDMKRLAEIARSDQTAAVLAAWATGPGLGAKAFRAAHGSSGVEPPDTPGLAWGSVMGSDEACALDAAERALGEAVATGELVPGRSRWRSAAVAITEQVLTRPLEVPPGQSLGQPRHHGARRPLGRLGSTPGTRRVAVLGGQPPAQSDRRAARPGRTHRPDPLASQSRWRTWWRRADAEQLSGAGLGPCRRGAIRLVGLVQGAPVRGRRTPALLCARGRGPASPGPPAGAAPAPHLTGIAAAGEPCGPVACRGGRDRRRRRLYARCDRSGRPPPGPWTGRAGRARRRRHPDSWSAGLVNLQWADHPRPHLVRDLGAAPLVAAVFSSRRDRVDLGARNWSASQAPHRCPAPRRRTDDPRLPPITGRGTTPQRLGMITAVSLLRLLAQNAPSVTVRISCHDSTDRDTRFTARHRRPQAPQPMCRRRPHQDRCPPRRSAPAPHR